MFRLEETGVWWPDQTLLHSVLGAVQGAGDVVLVAEGVQLGEVLGRQGEAEGLHVGLDAVGRQRLGQDDVAARGAPVEQDLGRRLAVLLGDLDDARVLQLVAARQRRVRLNGDAVLAAHLDEVLTLAERVHLDLVDGRHNLGLGQQLVQVRGAEVGDADGSDLAEFLGCLQSSPGLVAFVLVIGWGVN